MDPSALTSGGLGKAKNLYLGEFLVNLVSAAA